MKKDPRGFGGPFWAAENEKLPEIISDPEAIIRMDNGRLNLLAMVKTQKGGNTVVSIELNTVKDINSKYKKCNLVVSVVPSKDNYMRNNLFNHGVQVEYQKEDLPQVNHQLYEWLAIVNDKSSGNSITHPENSVNRKNSLSEKYSDEAYLSAVERGNMETAQRMVDEAAKAAGYTIKTYHGTNAEFTVFDARKSRVGAFGKGFYLSPSKANAGMYGSTRKFAKDCGKSYLKSHRRKCRSSKVRGFPLLRRIG